MATLKVANIHFDAAGTTLIRANGANTITFNTANAEDVRIDSAGNVLIGRTTSTVGQNVRLDVNGAANTSDILVNGTSVSPLGQQTIWVPASAMYPRFTGGPEIGTIVTTTYNTNIKTLNFDTATYEFAQFVIQMPKSWNQGTLIFQFVWTHGVTTSPYDVEWVVRSVSYADNDNLDALISNDVVARDTGGTANNVYISPETQAHTVTGAPGPEELVLFEVFRNYVSASDTMAIDARLIGVKIHYTINTAKDD